MKVISFRYPDFFMASFLVSMVCVMTIILILQNSGSVTVDSALTEYDAVLSFLDENGVKADTDELILSDVRFEEGSAGYDDYFKLQLSQGFDISSCSGFLLKKYSFPINSVFGKEYPDGFYVNVYMKDVRIVAAEILCVTLDGFMEGVISEKK